MPALESSSAQVIKKVRGTAFFLDTQDAVCKIENIYSYQ